MASAEFAWIASASCSYSSQRRRYISSRAPRLGRCRSAHHHSARVRSSVRCARRSRRHASNRYSRSWAYTTASAREGPILMILSKPRLSAGAHSSLRGDTVDFDVIREGAVFRLAFPSLRQRSARSSALVPKIRNRRTPAARECCGGRSHLRPRRLLSIAVGSLLQSPVRHALTAGRGIRGPTRLRQAGS